MFVLMVTKEISAACDFPTNTREPPRHVHIGQTGARFDEKIFGGLCRFFRPGHLLEFVFVFEAIPVLHLRQGPSGAQDCYGRVLVVRDWRRWEKLPLSL